MLHSKPNPADIADARQVLEQHPEIHRRKLRRVVLDGETRDYVQALFTLAAGYRFDWSLDAWQCVLNKIDESEATVGEWMLRSHVES